MIGELIIMLFVSSFVLTLVFLILLIALMLKKPRSREQKPRVREDLKNIKNQITGEE